MRTRPTLRTMIATGLLLPGLLGGGLLLAPVTGAQPVASAAAMAASSVAPARFITVRKRPRATLTAVRETLVTGTIKVSVTTNAKKVKLSYRSAKGTKRTATIKVRSGAGVKVLPVGAKRIKAIALATSKLRASRWITVKPPPLPPPPQPVLRYDLAGAVGVAVSNGQLMGVGADGRLWGARLPGSAASVTAVQAVALGTDGGVYVLMGVPINPQTGATGGCHLVRIDRATGWANCVDSDQWNYVWTGPVSPRSMMRFTEGALYYAGVRQDSSGNSFIRRFANGTVAQYPEIGGVVSDFVPLPDGSILVSGSSGSNPFLRRLTLQGGFQQLLSQYVYFLRVFPDGNVYMGVDGPQGGVRRFLTASGVMDPVFWLARSFGGEPPSYFDLSAICSSVSGDSGLCMSSGAWVSDIELVSGVALVAVGVPPKVSLAEYYPAVVPHESSLESVMQLEAVGDVLAMVGLDSDGRYQLVLRSMSTSVETAPPALRDIEITRLLAANESTRFMFEGLRLTDGVRVIGAVDPVSQAVTVTPTGQGQLSSFETW